LKAFYLLGRCSGASPPWPAWQSHMTEDEKGKTIRIHLSLIMQHLLPSYAIALPWPGETGALPVSLPLCGGRSEVRVTAGAERASAFSAPAEVRD
jgi:hypothetical protein